MVTIIRISAAPNPLVGTPTVVYHLFGRGTIVRGTLVLRGQLSLGAVVWGNSCPGGTFVLGDVCPGGQLSKGANVRGTNVGFINSC